MYPNFCYPILEGEFGNPLASSYLRPTTQHIEELSKKYPTLSAWLLTDRVTFLDRAITFSVPAGQTVVQSFNVSGGYDCLIFQKTASVTQTEPPGAGVAFQQLPSEQASRVTLQIARKDGPVDTEQAPVQNNLGFGFFPAYRPTPEFWSGKDVREFTLTNNTIYDMTVTITFTLVLL